MTQAPDHPVATALIAAAGGRYPPVDGLAEVVPPDAWGAHAVVSFTGHAYVMTARSPGELEPFEIDGFGAATDPRVLTFLAGPAGRVGSLDVVLVRRGLGGGSTLATREDLDHHPRVRRSRHHRRHVRVLGDERGLVTIGSGLVGRTEMSVELMSAPTAGGVGRRLIAAALHDVDDQELVFAQVAPGNAASLRAFLACAFVPIGSEVLIEPDRDLNA